MDKERYKLINELKFQYLSDMKDNNRKCLSYVFRAAVSLLDALTRLSAIQDEFDKANRKVISLCTFCEFSPPSSGDVNRVVCVRLATIVFNIAIQKIANSALTFVRRWICGMKKRKMIVDMLCI